MIIRINSSYKYIDYSNIKTIKGIITDIYVDDEKIDLIIKNDFNIKATYYYEELNNNFHLGDEVILYGDMSIPEVNTNFNLFNYNNYLKSKGIYYLFNIKKIEKINSNSNILFSIKNKVIELVKNNKAYNYLYTFILGDNRYLDEQVKSSYQYLGISHLFSISGMHISVLTGIILLFFKNIKIDENIRYYVCCIFIVFYMFLVNFCPSVLRSGIFFIMLSINKVFSFNIKSINLLLLTVSFIIFINPFLIYNTGFLFSSIITASLIIYSDIINKYDNGIYRLFSTSLISFLYSFPLSIYSYYQINILTILYNVFFVPVISMIIFPLALLSFIFPFISNIFIFLIHLLEFLVLKLSLIDSNIIFSKPNLFLILFYYLIISLVLYYKNKIIHFIFFIIILIHYNYNIIYQSTYFLSIDIGQGDCFLFHDVNKNILIDTGGNYDRDLGNDVIIPVLKSLGIKKLDLLILTHGDYDHMGEAINLVNNFKVEKVIFNCGVYNSLEKELIEVLDKKKIKYYSCIKELNINNNKLYFLNNKDYGNENDNSVVIYTEIMNNKFLLMGDASKKVEQDLIEKYNLFDIDLLKVGHHGSKTSSSIEFINEINPKYSLISVGKNNKFGHPNEEVLDVLEESKIYRTDIDGSVKLVFVDDNIYIDTSL